MPYLALLPARGQDAMCVGHGGGRPVQRHHRHRLQQGSSTGQRCSSDTRCAVVIALIRPIRKSAWLPVQLPCTALAGAAPTLQLHHGMARLPPRLRIASTRRPNILAPRTWPGQLRPPVRPSAPEGSPHTSKATSHRRSACSGPSFALGPPPPLQGLPHQRHVRP